MPPRVTIECIDRPDVSVEARLRDYDELGERTRVRFPVLVREADGAVPVAPPVARELAQVDVIKYTDYYRVETE